MILVVTEPPLVRRALALAAELGFERSSIPEVGQLLRVLAAGRWRIAEIGTGVGVGAAWVADALPPGAVLLTVEADAERAEAAARLFEGEPGVRVAQGDWHEVLPQHAPFDLLFFDGGAWKQQAEEESPRVLELLAPGGVVVIDDLTPDSPASDPVRDFWLGHPDVFAVELVTTPASAVILAARQPSAAAMS
jgi:predicted O-methyltransferase YrrM